MSQTDREFGAEETPGTNGTSPPSSPDGEDADLAAQLEYVEGVNERLRTKLRAVQRTRYRRGAAGLLALALVAVGGAVVFGEYRDLLLALAATAAVVAFLTTVLLRGRFLSATTSEAVYSALAVNERRLANELELEGPTVYVPLDDAVTAQTAVERVRLFVGKHARTAAPLADPTELEPLFTIPQAEGGPGISLRPTGGGLLGEYLASASEEFPEEPGAAARQLADALVEGFELVRRAEVDATDAERQIVFTVVDSAYGDVTRFDHPVASFVACGLAVARSTPVICETMEGDSDGAYIIICRWDEAAGLETSSREGE
jgi:energy-converting hydrogenase Eha subunit E